MSPWKQRYTTVALVAFNTCLLLLVINVALWAAMRLWQGSRRLDPIAAFGTERVM